MSLETVKINIENQILVMTISRPDALNALNAQVFDDLAKIISEIPGDVRGAILTGEGEKAFAAGADIREFSEFDGERARDLSRSGQEIFSRIENLHVPVIAVVNGFALGGGCELAMACHLRIAEDHARFGQPEVNLGLIPGYGGTQRMTQLIGRTKALEFMMTGEMITANEAHRLGLVNAVVHKGEGMGKAKELLEKIASKAPLAISRVITAVNGAGKKGFALESELFGSLFETSDAKEGISAFMDKRKPDFRGK